MTERRKTEPTRVIPAVERALPIRANPRTDNVDACMTKSNTLQLSLNRIQFRVERELPSWRKSATEQQPEKRAPVKTDTPLPIREKERKLSELPQCTNCNAEALQPNLAKERNEKEDPTQTSSNTETPVYNCDRVVKLPDTENPLPRRVKPLIETEDPQCAKDKRDIAEPKRIALRTDKDDDTSTWCKIDKVKQLPTAASPLREHVLPMRANPRMEIVDPNWIASYTERPCPIRAYERVLIEEPMDRKSVTLKDPPSAFLRLAPATLNAEPSRAKARQETELPKLIMSKMLVTEPKLALQRKDIELLILRALNTDRSPPTRALPIMDTALPTLAKDRRLTALPTVIKPNVLMALANLADERTEMELPKELAYSTLTFRQLPKAASPATLKLLPILTKLRNEHELPTWANISTDAKSPLRTKPRTDTALPKDTLSRIEVEQPARQNERTLTLDARCR